VSADRRVLLAGPGADPSAVAAQLPAGTRWAFLSPDYVSFLDWEAALGPAEPVASAMALTQTALREPFLDAITKLGRRHASLGWWTSRLSERNPLVSPLYQRCCQLAVARGLADRVDEPLLVVSDSVAVLESLVGSWVVQPPRSRGAAGLGRSAWRAARFALGALRRRPGLGRPEPGRVVAVRTWLDDSCFGDDGVFRDRYFPGLVDWLEQRGHRVVTLPVFVNVTRGDAWRWLRDNPREFVAAADLLTARDYAFALRVGLRQARRRLGRVELDGLDVSALFEEERIRVRFDRGSLEAIAWSRVPGHLADAGLTVDMLVQGYENMIEEKGLVMGARASTPDTRLVGFQHGALYPTMLCNFVTRGESEFAPLPDRVVCNGELFREILVREGLPADRAVVGPALRYRHLREPSGDSERGDTILILLPLVPDAAAELLHKCFAALAGIDRDVLVKPHPMASRDALLAAAGADALPAGWEWVDGGMAPALDRAAVAVSLGSSALHEALAAGVPVVAVGRDAALVLDPLGWYDDLGRLQYDAAAIRVEVDRQLSLDPEAYEAYRRRAREVLDESFARATDATLLAFAPETIGAAR
jgi:hypothetical protein